MLFLNLPSLLAFTLLIVRTAALGSSSPQFHLTPTRQWDTAKKCLVGETACSVGRTYECIDTTSDRSSCGGCLWRGGAEKVNEDVGVNCRGIAGSKGVSCRASECVVSSCLPGWKFSLGRCTRSRRIDVGGSSSSKPEALAVIKINLGH